MNKPLIEGLRESWQQSAQDLPIANYSRDEVFEIAVDRLYNYVDKKINKAFFALSDESKNEIKMTAFPFENYE